MTGLTIVFIFTSAFIQQALGFQQIRGSTASPVRKSLTSGGFLSNHLSSTSNVYSPSSLLSLPSAQDFSLAPTPYGLDEDPKDVYMAGQAMKLRETLIRVILPSLAAAGLAVLCYAPFCLFLKGWLDTGELSILGNDSSQFMQNFLSLNGLLFSILAGNSFYFLYQQTESIYYALYAEVSEAKSLLEQTTLVCAGRPFYRDVLVNIQRYIEQDLRRLDYPPAVLLSAKPSNDPLESILYQTSVGVPSSVYETVKSLRQARGQRLGATQRKLPEVHFTLLYLLATLELASFPLLGAGTSSLFTNSILSVQSVLFGCMAGAITMTLTVIRELWNPTGGAYNVDGVLVTMVRGLEEETQRRIEGGTFAERSLPSAPPSYNTSKQGAIASTVSADATLARVTHTSKRFDNNHRRRWQVVQTLKASPRKIYSGAIRLLPWKRIISVSSTDV